MALESPTEVITDQLAEYLKKNVSGVKEVISGFPEANRNLKYPSISLLAEADTYINWMPYIFSKEDTVGTEAKVKYVVGQFNWRIQVDIWERSKEQREDFMQKFFLAFHKSIPAQTGLHLTLEEYHNVGCSYTMVGYKPNMNDERSQKKEWRATVDLVANCRAVVDSKQYVMTQLDVEQTVTEGPTLDDAGPEETETITVFP